jgi:hypothetical protein
MAQVIEILDLSSSSQTSAAFFASVHRENSGRQGHARQRKVCGMWRDAGRRKDA